MNPSCSKKLRIEQVKYILGQFYSKESLNSETYMIKLGIVAGGSIQPTIFPGTYIEEFIKKKKPKRPHLYYVAIGHSTVALQIQVTKKCHYSSSFKTCGTICFHQCYFHPYYPFIFCFQSPHQTIVYVLWVWDTVRFAIL